ncbi:MAG: PaaI family thioesterase [Pelosinus sp.]|nr:PaaI family thioesterase [Pelosinus sp.]
MELNKCKEFFEQQDHYAKHSGIEIVKFEPGYAKVQMPIKDFHLNGVKIVHGGAIFTLADYAFGIASNSRGQIAVSINASISYIKAVSSGTLLAEAKEVSLEARLSNYIINITNEQNQLIAVFHGTAYRKKDYWQWADK